MITLRNLAKSFGDHLIWQHLSMQFEQGMLHALTGHSGSGKSTLLKCIGLLE